MSSTTTTAPSVTSSAANGTISVSGNLKIVGIILAITSGVLIGSSFVFKKKGLLRSQQGMVAGEGVGYLKSPLWWLGMIMMILGELCNFAAYAFVEAIVVTPMGALSVVISAALSSMFLKETLSFFGWLGCGLCVLGSVIIALNGPEESTIGQITEFQKLFLAPGFLVYGSVLIIASLVIIFWFAPRYGKKSMLWYIMVCSMIGGISVSVTTGLGSAIVTTAMGDNQFKHWFIYFLIVFIAVTLITEVYYLNVALALFNTAMVTPTYYVIFTFFSMVTTIVLFQGLDAPVVRIITLVMGFLVICVGITVLQLSKIDPTQIKTLDRRSTLLLQAARVNPEDGDEKSLVAIEDPGMDALRGSFGTMGSIIRARSARRLSMSSRASVRSRYSSQPVPPLPNHYDDHLTGMKRHQLYDKPVPTTPRSYVDNSDQISMASQPSGLGSPFAQRKQTIKFGDQDVVHSYHVPGTGDDSATHEHRSALHGGASLKYDSTPTGAPQILNLPSLEDITDPSAPLTAPPVLSSRGNSGKKSFHPFDGLPSTTTSSVFPDATPLPPPSSTPGARDPPSTPLTPTSRLRQLQLFGRSPSGRPYPRGDRDDDREESLSLWNRSSGEGSDLVENTSETDLPGGGIRLVPSSNNTRDRSDLV